jgi:hypothetical protein
MKPWDGIIPESEQRAYSAAGFGQPSGIGRRPALLIIDVQYRTTGTEPLPFWDSIREFPTSCGEVGWRAVTQIARLLAMFRARDGRSSIPMCHQSRASTGGGWPRRYPR